MLRADLSKANQTLKNDLKGLSSRCKDYLPVGLSTDVKHLDINLKYETL